MSEVLEPKRWSRRKFTLALASVGGSALAISGLKLGGTEAVTALPVFRGELERTKEFFNTRAAEIMAKVGKNWGDLTSEIALKGDIVFFNREKPNLAKPIASFNAETVSELKQVVKDIHETYAHKMTSNEPTGVLKQDTNAWNQVQLSGEAYSAGRLNIDKLSGRLENPVSGKQVNFEFQAWNTDPEAPSFNQKGIVVYFRGIDKIHQDEELMIQQLIQENYGVLTIGYAEGEAFPREAVIKFDDKVDIKTIAKSFPEIRRLDYHEYEDAYAVLCMLIASKVVAKNAPIHTIGVSYGAVQCINFALLSQAGGHEIGKVLSYAGMHDLLNKRFTSAPSDLLRFELLHTRYLLPTRAREELLRLSPKYTVPYIGLDCESLVLVVGEEDDLISPQHTLELAESLDMASRDIFIIPGLKHAPDDEYIKNFDAGRELNKVMSRYERRKLRGIMQDLQGTGAFEFSRLLLRLGRFIPVPVTRQERRSFLRIPE